MAVEIEYKVDYSEVDAADESINQLKSDTEEAQESTSLFGGATEALGAQLSGLTDRFGVLGGSISSFSSQSVGAIKGVKGLTTGFKALDLILKASVIGLIVAAIVTLGVNLTKTAKGADFLRKAMATLEGVFNGVVDVLVNLDKIFSRNIIDVFDKNIKQAQQLAKLQRGVAEANRLLSIELARTSIEFEKFSQIADDATLSLREQQAAAQEAAKLELAAAQDRRTIALNNLNIIKAEVAATKSRNEVISQDTKDSLAEAQIAYDEAAAEIELSQLRNAQRIRQIDQDTFEQRLDFLIDFTDNQKAVNERLIADETIALEERERLLAQTVIFTDKAFEDAFKAFEKQAGQRLDVNMLLQESDADVVSNYLRGTQLSEIETTRFLEFIRERRTFTQDLAELEKDLATEKEEDELARMERRKEREARDYEARVELAILRQDDEIKQEIARRNLLLAEVDLTESERRLIIEQSETNITEIKKAEEEKRVNLQREALRVENQNLQQVGQILSGFGEAGLVAQKAIAFRQATINTYQGATLALANIPPPFGFAVAAAVVAAGLSNVAQIASSDTGIPPVNVPNFQPAPAEFNKGVINLGGADGIDNIPAMLTRGESVMTQSETRDFYPTLMAIRKSAVDPDLLNAIAVGNTPEVIDASKVIEVPTQHFSMDENGFSQKVYHNGNRISRKQNRFSWK